MIEIIKENWTSILKFGLPMVISTASLIVSYTTYRNNKKNLDVTLEPKLTKIPGIYTGETYIQNDDGMYMCYLKVVNPSSSDIGYFDLRVIDTAEPNNSLPVYNELTLKRHFPDVTYFEYPSSIGLANLNAPPSNYGVFESNSYTRLDIPFTPNPDTKTVIVTFKVAIKSRKENPYANDRKKFKYYSATYKLDTDLESQFDTVIS
ncbi:hypothetical protein B4117_4321 [Bacillus mycoides]|uniref:hypothetical protein n=1 Tax=Bacillus mycoides TaxID=1405 RepID=UPI0007AB9F42|nr:hypothetical protein [Bacillus mycoides]KZE04151.1 hypothetical protein B4117_4321 [Bacillus mycoides]